MGANIHIGMVKDPLDWLWWERARAFLDPALALSDEDWPEIEAELRADTMQLWAVMHGPELLAAAVTRIAETVHGEVAEIYLTGGMEHRVWAADLAAAIRDSACEAGCIKTRVIGRLGWKNILAGAGFRPTAMVYEAAA